MPGPSTAVRAVSFDLWDTVFVDDSDEPKRRRLGLAPKKQARRDLLEKFLGGKSGVSRERIDAAYGATDAAFSRAWKQCHVTWTVAERLEVVLAGLDRRLEPEGFTELTRLHEDMELEVRPDLVAGIEPALKSLSSRYKLVVVSDAIFSPGRALRELLKGYGLLGYFKGFVFSDEFGRSKPAPEVFHKAAELAGCAVSELVHIGDREHNDVAGPKAVGARAVLATAAIDRGSASTKADAVCSDFSKLARIIDDIGGKS